MPVRDFRVRPLEVLVVDDDRIFGESLAHFLNDDQRIAVCDIASDLDTALQSTTERHFDLALVDVRLDSRESGFQVVAALLERHPGLTALMMSGLDKSEIEAQALACGALGVLEKTDLARRGQGAVLDAYVACTG
jgi:DNA-binding NtrC family response regulator